MLVNLTSDTATQPTPPMLQAMFAAAVGDDVFRQDPTVNRLESSAAERFGMEAALFCPSGTMTNQLAIKCHTQALDEVICEEKSHVYQYEGGVYAMLSSVSMNLIQGERGKLLPGQIAAAVKPRYDWLPISRLLVLENTCNKGGGSIYTLAEASSLVQEARKQKLACHLDGARLFNALVETGESTEDWGRLFDTVSICLSKGLGAPVGSLLLGPQELIDRARRYRKVIGGGMRQAGYLAAAGLYALEHHVERLAEDNARARRLAATLTTLPCVSRVEQTETNICIFHLSGSQTASQFLEKLEEYNIKAVAFGPQTIRFTTHLGVSDAMIEYVEECLGRL
ncbi:GntG family PLP-dependent aldolase [Neolewinella lacunae]|uniref:Threonine aldolase n=1 Tax=Neolewinella lacunae TaxID=1517758 RepID=A0A923PJ71_9BACT|nr:GntG family PLP-dependent aldolase [Neolewinella lacunae]MBC6995070.1 threonine aldolase [Neolewinella lacunae]MDN3635381.1 GntG family PLP-dependent aldolase [Neolewinella lacunae]